MLDLVGLGDRLDYLPGSLSGGQKQRVAVARALVPRKPRSGLPQTNPTLRHLDRTCGRTVVEMLKDLGRDRGTTTVMVTHDKPDPRPRGPGSLTPLEDGRNRRGPVRFKRRHKPR